MVSSRATPTETRAHRASAPKSAKRQQIIASSTIRATAMLSGAGKAAGMSGLEKAGSRAGGAGKDRAAMAVGGAEARPIRTAALASAKGCGGWIARVKLSGPGGKAEGGKADIGNISRAGTAARIKRGAAPPGAAYEGTRTAARGSVCAVGAGTITGAVSRTKGPEG